MRRIPARARALALAALAAGCVFSPPTGADDAAAAAIPDRRRAAFRFAYTIRPAGRTDRIVFRAVLPETLPARQEIRALRVSVPPTRVFRHGRERYAEWVLRNVRAPLTIAVEVEAVLHRYDLTVARRDPAPLDPPVPRDRAAEPYIETESAALRSLADTLPGGEDPVATARAVHEAVLDRLERSAFNPGEVGAEAALRTGAGDCTEFADLFVALLRIKGVPARVAEGLVTKGRDTLKHNWAEYHAGALGWIPVDPSNAESGTARFDALRPIYLRLSTARNDPVLRGHYWRYTYSGGPPPEVSASVRLMTGEDASSESPDFPL
jgi:transglutaminase-like putative cysteine protease